MKARAWSCVDINFHTLVKFRYLRVVTNSLHIFKLYARICWTLKKKTIPNLINFENNIFVRRKFD